MVNTVATSPDYAWSPQIGPQADACATAGFCDELFYGGAAGGGKTDFLIGDFASDLHQGVDWVGIIFRQSFPELEEVIERTNAIYPMLGGEYLVGQKVWRFASGALLRLRQVENVADFTKYLGHSYSFISFDELPTWENLRPYHMMKSRLRGPARNKRMRASGNPGGRCHGEIKEYFEIGEHPTGYHLISDGVSKMNRMFIPSKVTDNKILLENDPGYIDRLKGVGDPELVKAWLEGDWDAVVGSYFGMFNKSDAVVEPFEIPEEWKIFTCMDYGEHNPCWAGVIAVDYDDDIWVVDEYYRAEAGGADHARGVRDLIDSCPYISKRPRNNLAPSDMWTSRRPGEVNQALAPKDAFRKEGLPLTKANMDRVNGWRNLKDLMYAGRIKFFQYRTAHILSSLASVQRDENNPEDVMKGGDDHPADGLRYGINHVYKPRKRPTKAPPAPNSGEYVMKQLEPVMGTRYS